MHAVYTDLLSLKHMSQAYFNHTAGVKSFNECLRVTELTRGVSEGGRSGP